jgi:hypothetical protein
MKWKTKRVEDVAAPVVGKFYLVPCVFVALLKKWWPVIGPWHEDADLGVESFHFHYDVRFLAERDFWNGERTMARVHAHLTSKGRWLSTAAEEKGVPELVYLRLKMKRVMPVFPFSPFFAEKVERPFLETRLTCRVCPHRGMSLEGLPEDSEGRVVCNGHGLRWNLKTGRLCPRAAHEGVESRIKNQVQEQGGAW